MNHTATFDQVKQLATQLSLQEQLRIVAHITRYLSERAELRTVEERQQSDYARQVESFLKMSEELAAETVGEVDSAEDVRHIRDERMARL